MSKNTINDEIYLHLNTFGGGIQVQNKTFHKKKKLIDPKLHLSPQYSLSGIAKSITQSNDKASLQRGD